MSPMNVIKHKLYRLKSTLAQCLSWVISQAKFLLICICSPKGLKGGLILLLITLFVVFVIVLFSGNAEEWFSQLIGVPEGERAKMELLTFLGLSMGGVLLALQAISANTRAKAMEDTAKNTELGQRQERLKNAIEHLGSPADSVRLGGIYELFHLAEDTIEWRKTILDILCAHIRRTTSEKNYQDTYPGKPSEEIQSMLSLLFVQKHEIFKELRVTLDGSWLNGADLSKARLQSAILKRTKLQGANLFGAQLQGAVLSRAQLRDANLEEAQMQGSYLVGAMLQGAFLMGTHLQKAILAEAQLQGANLSNAQLQEAVLSKTQLQNANFKQALLQGTYLSGAQAQNVRLNGARLQNAVLKRAQLQGANLSNARLQGARLNGAHLQGTNLSWARLQGARLDKAQLQGANLTEALLQGASLIRAQLQGATLNRTRLQGAILAKIQLQGVISEKYDWYSFEALMTKRIDKESDLSEVIFVGGLTQEDLNSCVEDLPADTALDLREKLMLHVNTPISHAMPEDSRDVNIGTFSKAKAAQWIIDYKKAMSEDPIVNV